MTQRSPRGASGLAALVSSLKPPGWVDCALLAPGTGLCLAAVATCFFPQGRCHSLWTLSFLTVRVHTINTPSTAKKQDTPNAMAKVQRPSSSLGPEELAGAFWLAPGGSSRDMNLMAPGIW